MRLPMAAATWRQATSTMARVRARVRAVARTRAHAATSPPETAGLLIWKVPFPNQGLTSACKRDLPNQGLTSAVLLETGSEGNALPN